jgi:transcriptional regulator with XRE-family HTH domain
MNNAPTQDTIAQRLRKLRTQRGWSFAQLGQRSGLDGSTVWKIESGATPNPGQDTLGKIARALGVSLSEIVGETPLPRRRTEIIEGVARVPMMRVRVDSFGHVSWEDTRETVVVSAQIAAGRPNLRAVYVTGNRMLPYVAAGECVVFDPDQPPQDRDMVLITTSHGDVQVSWFRVDADGVPYLRAADNWRMSPADAHVEGVVLTVERRALRDPT